MKHSVRWITAIVLIFASLHLIACAPAPAAQPKVAPSKLETVEGSEFKRVVLTEKATERLQIRTVAVRAEPVDRTWRVGGEVVAMPAASPATASPTITNTVVDAQAADLRRVRVRVNLSESELSMIDRNRSAHVRPLGIDDEDEDDDDELEAEPDDADDITDDEKTPRSAGSAQLFYSVNNANAALTPGRPVMVELFLAGGGAERKIVPFAALLYGVHGETWVYTNPEPLVFVRAPVTVDFIENDLVYLTAGPAAGAQVVTVGGSLLLGAETGVSK